MKRQELKTHLLSEINWWGKKGYVAIKEELANAMHYSKTVEGTTINFEATLLECTPEYVHVSISADDGALFRFMFPVSHSFLVYVDGKVEK